MDTEKIECIVCNLNKDLPEFLNLKGKILKTCEK